MPPVASCRRLRVAPIVLAVVGAWTSGVPAQTLPPLRPFAPIQVPARLPDLRTPPIAFVGLAAPLPDLFTPPIRFAGLHPTLPDQRTPPIAFAGDTP